MAVATREIKAERNITDDGDEEYQMLTPPERPEDTSYHPESTGPSYYGVGTGR